MTSRFDHLVIAATTLEQGVEYVKDTLGVDVPKGGEHLLMGTHNHLMQLGGEIFLEIVAVNPTAQAPQRPRWFGLDDQIVQASLAEQPRLVTWVVNTTNLDNVLSKTQFQFGQSTPVTRGNLNWLFAVPDDGRLLASGMLPYLMQWQTDTHPATAMVDLGCRLTSLSIYHPYPDWISSILEEIGASSLVKVEQLKSNTQPYLAAELETPSGTIRLESRSR